MTRLLAVVGAALVAAPVGAAPPGVASLVAQLGAERYADRERATRALEAAGPDAVSVLEAATRSPNPEVARRAAAVLAKLRRNADNATHLAVKPVRLAYRDTPLGTAVADLKARTGINLSLDAAKVADPLRPVTCETGDLPPWEAVAAFCRAAGLREAFAAELAVPKPDVRRNRTYYTPPPAPTAAEVPVVLADGTPDVLPGNRLTPVRVVALPRSFAGLPSVLDNGDVVLHFDVTPLSGLNWQGVAGVRVTKLIDDAGRFGTGAPGRAADPASPDVYEGPVILNGGGVIMGFDSGEVRMPTTRPNPRVLPVPLRVATPSARSLRLLEGVVVGEVVVPNQPLVSVADPAGRVGSVAEAADGTRLTVLEVTPASNGGTTVRVRAETASPWLALRRRNPWGPLWPDMARPVGAGVQVRAFDAAGNAVSSRTATAQTSDDSQTQTTTWKLTYPGGAPAKLVVSGPKTVAVDVPFRMENVPLP